MLIRDLLSRASLTFIVWGVVASAPALPDSPVPNDSQSRGAGIIPQPQMAHDVVRIPMVEGRGLRFRRISSSEGLSQTRVSQIVQDDRGLLWFGTQYGLNRYDGYEFKLFVHDPQRTDSLSGAFITALFKDRSGMLWIGCSEFLDQFDPTTETFRPIRFHPRDHQTFAGGVVHISQDQGGTLWFATGSGLYGLNPVTHELVHFQHDPHDSFSLPTNDVNWTGEDREGRFWVGTSAGLDELDPSTGHVTYHVPLAEGGRISFFEDKDGLFWITYPSGNGLARLDRAGNIVTRYSFYAREPPPTALTGVMGIVEDHDGNLWLGSPGAGLLRFDRQSQVVVHYGNHPGDPQSIAEDKVIALFADRDGNIWTGLHSKGPNVFTYTGSEFETFRHDFDDPNSLSLDFVNAIYEDAAGALWIGNDDGLNRIERATGRRTSWTAGLGAKPMVITITQDRAGFIWFGTFGHGLNSFDPKTGRFRSYRHVASEPRSLSSDEVHRMLVDHAGVLWVGTNDGLDRYDPRTDDFTVYKADWNSHGSQSYLAIAEDSAGKLWLGTHHSGLHRFDPDTGQFTVYRSDPADPATLRDDTVPAVYVSRTGSLWLGTQNGLERFEPGTGLFSAFDMHDGLPGNAVGCILEDGSGNLWVSTNRGLSRFDPARRTFNNYSELDGLPGNDLTGWGSCFESRRGELFFAGYPGAVALFPEKVVDRPYTPQVVLTDFRLAGASVPINPTSPLKRSITYTEKLTLSHTQNIFSVTFASLNYLSPQATRYRYQLEGLDRRWNEVGSDRRQATYTTLPAGNYTLRVQAAASRGAWNEQGASLAVEILPAWWQTWTFRTVCALLTLLTIWYAYRLRIRQVSRQLTIRMEERIDERTRIAQELHDTLLQGLASASLQLQVADGQMASDAAKPLVQRVLQLLRQLMHESRHTVQGLRVRRSELQDLEHAFAQFAKDLAPAFRSKFHLVVEGIPRPLQPLIRDEVYRIGSEAISNAFRHSRAEAVETVLEYGRDRLRLLVRDDGQGITPDVLQSGRAGHFGLFGIRERAAKIGARLRIRSAAGAGTEIDLIVPAIVAFERATSGRRRDWLARLYSHGDRQ